MKLKKKIVFRLITFFYMSGILYYSLQSSKAGHGGVARDVFNNFLHIPVYGVLAYFILNCFSSFKVKIYFLTFIIATLYGIIIEFSQSFIPGRVSSLMDISLNTIGIILLLGCSYYFNVRNNTQYLSAGRQDAIRD